MKLLRTLLFAPGNRPRMVGKVATFGADAVILDLEDSVPLTEKEATRQIVRQAVETIAVTTRTPVYVRINPLGSKTSFSRDLAAQDLQVVVCSHLTGVFFPKVESPEEILTIDHLLSELEQALGIPTGSIEVVPILETARGIVNAYEIACTSPRRVPRVALGAGDLTLDLGIAWTRDETEIFYARSHVVLASRAAGIEPPLDTIYPIIHDEEGLIRSAKLARQLGFQGKTCIHPRQVGPVNQVFSPTAEEVTEARRVVEAFEQAEREGKASVQLDGRMLDYPIVEQARRLLARAEAIAMKGEPGATSG